MVKHPINWPLSLGLIIVGFTLFIALLGPSIAPRNPLEEQRVIQHGDVWISAPYPPFTVEGYPLGSDKWGRDVLSQMLWALRPTLMLVGYVAVLRLLVGTGIGLLAGWNSGPFGNILNALIGAALSIPIIIIALATVATLGTTYGPWGFVLGLSITGWADTARMVRDQTIIIRSQPFIESARAMGASSRRLLIGHVLRQIIPFLWMLFTFEISSTLLLTAGLGFLGYYVGGEVWVWISDTVAARLSGMPELGQMLSGVSEDIYTGPWKMFAAGTLVFITILGFNLLGEGLRRQANAHARTSALWEKIQKWLWQMDDERVTPSKKWIRAHPVQSVFGGFLLLAALIALSYQWSVITRPQPLVYPVPGGHLWGSQYHDPYGTLWAQAEPINQPQVIWQYQDAGGFSGGPAVSNSGEIYLATLAGQLIALSPEGQLIWQKSLPAAGVGSPALDVEGNIYVADQSGGLSSFTSTGEFRWNNRPDGDFEATSGPIVGINNIAYYTVIGDVRAISSAGELLWQKSAYTRRVTYEPILSPDENLVFLRNTALITNSGQKISFDNPLVIEQFVVGLDGNLQARFESQLYAWEFDGERPQILNHMQWSRTSFFGFPSLMGVLPDKSAWIHYTSPDEDSNLLWVDAEGETINHNRLPYRPSILIAFDAINNFYLCGSNHGKAECSAVALGQTDPFWTFELPEGVLVTGGALVPDRFYVATQEGFFFAIGD